MILTSTDSRCSTPLQAAQELVRLEEQQQACQLEAQQAQQAAQQAQHEAQRAQQLHQALQGELGALQCVVGRGYS